MSSSPDNNTINENTSEVNQLPRYLSSYFLNYIIWPFVIVLLATLSTVIYLQSYNIMDHLWNTFLILIDNPKTFIKFIVIMVVTYCTIQQLKLDDFILKFSTQFLSLLSYQPNLPNVEDICSIIDDTKIIVDGNVIISILCSNLGPTGKHAFLLFKFAINNKIEYLRADFGYKPSGTTFRQNRQTIQQVSR